MSTDDLLDQILRLPVPERALIAQRVLDSLQESPASVEAAWVPELERRAREIEEGRVQTVPWGVARARIERRLDARRADRPSS